jgi:hypothetical protein
MRDRRVTPAAVTALKEALADVYWYKSDLRSFLTAAVNRPELLSRLNWGDYKRNIVGVLIGQMSQHQDQYVDDLVRLMLEVAQFHDFSHLARLDDGEMKVKRARSAVEALRSHVAGHEHYKSRRFGIGLRSCQRNSPRSLALPMPKNAASSWNAS